MLDSSHWAAILAGGDGQRLRSYTRTITGDDRPKQFCALFGDRTLLRETRDRLFLQVEPRRTLYVVTRHHEAFYREELSDVARVQIIEQPSNRGTTAAIGYALLRLEALQPSAVIGFFPADHYYLDGDAFHRAIALAYAAAELQRDRIFLIGADADRAETEYEWIEPGGAFGAPSATGSREATSSPLQARIQSVVRFYEKPSLQVALGLLERNCLFNTFVMIGCVRAFTSILMTTVPEYWQTLSVLGHFTSTSVEREQAAELYSMLPFSDFSSDVLARRPDRLAVVPLGAAGWADLGHPAGLPQTVAKHRSNVA